MVDIWTKMMAVKQRNLDHAPDCPKGWVHDTDVSVVPADKFKRRLTGIMFQALKDGVKLEDLEHALNEAFVQYIMEQ